MTQHRQLNSQTMLDFFTSLGRTHKEVAKTLEVNNIKAKVDYCSDSCPLAIHAKNHFGVDFFVGVGVITTTPELSITTPRPCADFVRVFDAGGYRNLKDLS